MYFPTAQICRTVLILSFSNCPDQLQFTTPRLYCPHLQPSTDCLRHICQFCSRTSNRSRTHTLSIRSMLESSDFNSSVSKLVLVSPILSIALTHFGSSMVRSKGFDDRLDETVSADAGRQRNTDFDSYVDLCI